MTGFLLVVIGLSFTALSVITVGLLMDRWILRQFRWFI